MSNGILILFFILFVGGTYCGKDASCDSANMMNCLLSHGESAEREGLFFPDTQEKLSNYCNHLMKGLNCANDLLEKCASDEEKQMYRNLTHNMYGTNVALCTEGSPLSIKFLKHVGCFKKLSDKFKTCSDRYIGNILVVQGLSEEQHLKMTCCTVNEYNRCMRNVVLARCDKEAAELVEETVSRTLSTPMEYCSQLPDVPNRDCRRKFTPLSSQSSDDGSMDYPDSATPSRISLTLLTIILLRSMLFR